MIYLLKSHGDFAQLCKRLPEGIYGIIGFTAGWCCGTKEFYDFPYIGNVIIPTDELIFFRGVGLKPPTRVKSLGLYPALIRTSHDKLRGQIIWVSRCKTRFFRTYFSNMGCWKLPETRQPISNVIVFDVFNLDRLFFVAGFFCLIHGYSGMIGDDCLSRRFRKLNWWVGCRCIQR